MPTDACPAPADPALAFTVCEIAVPDADEFPLSWVARQTDDLFRTSSLDALGNEDLFTPVAMRAKGYRRQDDAMVVAFAAVSGVGTADLPRGRSGLPVLSWDSRHAGPEGELLGSASVHVGLTSNTHLAETGAEVREDARRRGVGRALMAECERVAVEHGCRTLTGWADQRPIREGEEVLVPSTGVLAVAADDPRTRFAQALGYALEQCEQHSMLDLPLPAERTARLTAEAEAHAAGYVTRSLAGPLPEDLVESTCALLTHFSESVPTGGLDLETTVWDAGRFRREEERRAAKGERTVSTVALDATGAVVAFTDLVVGDNRPGAAYQETTVVHSDHRGHRLGLLVKLRNLEALAQHHPRATRVHTWNAGENDHMLAINTAMGFTPRIVEGAWQKRV